MKKANERPTAQECRRRLYIGYSGIHSMFADVVPESPVAQDNIDDEERRRAGTCATPRSGMDVISVRDHDQGVKT